MLAGAPALADHASGRRSVLDVTPWGQSATGPIEKTEAPDRKPAANPWLPWQVGPGYKLPDPKQGLPQPRTRLPQPRTTLPQPRRRLPAPLATTPAPALVPPEPERRIPEPELVAPALRPVPSAPETVRPEPELAVPAPLPITPEPEAVRPEPELAIPAPQPITPAPETVRPEPELAIPAPPPAPPEPEAVRPEPELAIPAPPPAPPEPEAVRPEPELAVPAPQPITPEPEAVRPEPELAAPAKPESVPAAPPSYDDMPVLHGAVDPTPWPLDLPSATAPAFYDDAPSLHGPGVRSDGRDAVFYDDAPVLHRAAPERGAGGGPPLDLPAATTPAFYDEMPDQHEPDVEAPAADPLPSPPAAVYGDRPPRGRPPLTPPAVRDDPLLLPPVEPVPTLSHPPAPPAPPGRRTAAPPPPEPAPPRQLADPAPPPAVEPPPVPDATAPVMFDSERKTDPLPAPGPVFRHEQPAEKHAVVPEKPASPSAEPGIDLSGMAPKEKGLAIAREMDRRDLGFGDSASSLKMILRDRSGQTSTRELRLHTLEVTDEADGDKTLVIFERPGDIEGTALLSYTHIREADDQWLYLPALKRVKRISSSNKSGPFVGSEFAYEDMLSQEVGKYTYRWLRDEACGEMDCFVVERTPVYENSGYVRQVTWVDQTEFRILRVDFFDRKGDLMKTLRYKDYRKYLGRYWRAHELFMQNHQTGKSTTLAFADYEFRVGLSEQDLKPSRLKRLR